MEKAVKSGVLLRKQGPQSIMRRVCPHAVCHNRLGHFTTSLVVFLTLPKQRNLVFMCFSMVCVRWMLRVLRTHTPVPNLCTMDQAVILLGCETDSPQVGPAGPCPPERSPCRTVLC